MKSQILLSVSLLSIALTMNADLNAASIETKSGRPNLMLIISDDSTWRDFGFTGNKDVRTPHLDRLASQGLSMTSMFTPATTCSPSRHALYTGLFPIRSGAYPNHTRVYDGTKSMFTYLKDHGYRVALQGKEHVGPATSFPYEHIGGKNDDAFEKTREFVTRSKEQSWLLVFASNDPHSPWNRGPKGLHDPAKLTVPPWLHDNEKTRQLLADYYGEINKLDWQVGQLMAILDETKQADDTLVIFVSEQGSSFPYGGKWSVYDNGIRVATIVRWPGHVKAGSHSQSLVQYVDVPPTFLEAAGIDPSTIDTGCPDADGNRGFDGRSFLKLLENPGAPMRKYVFSQHTTVGINGYQAPYPMRAVRDQRYKYIRNLAPENTYSIGGIHKGQPIESWQEDAKSDSKLAARIDWLFHRPGEELYDLQSDELETQNLAADPKYQEIRQRLSAELDQWMKQQGDQGMPTELAAHSRQPGRSQPQPNSPDSKKPTPGRRKKKQASAGAE
ncbi:MAG: sulfatase [Planctomycetaceae bacterium]|nr:sulfatase [Planctomycetaceae bacterium]